MWYEEDRYSDDGEIVRVNELGRRGRGNVF